MNAKLRMYGRKVLIGDLLMIFLVVSLLILFVILGQQYTEIAAFIVSLLTLYLRDCLNILKK